MTLTTREKERLDELYFYASVQYSVYSKKIDETNNSSDLEFYIGKKREWYAKMQGISQASNVVGYSIFSVHNGMEWLKKEHGDLYCV